MNYERIVLYTAVVEERLIWYILNTRKKAP